MKGIYSSCSRRAATRQWGTSSAFGRWRTSRWLFFDPEAREYIQVMKVDYLLYHCNNREVYFFLGRSVSSLTSSAPLTGGVYDFKGSGGKDPYRPGAGLQQNIGTRFCTHMTKCSCGGTLVKREDQATEATLYDATGTLTVKVTNSRCSRNHHCGLTYGPNFVWRGPAKINTASLKDLEKMGAVFVSNRRGFTLRYLRLFENLLYRSGVSARAIDFAIKETFADPDDRGHGQEFLVDLRKLHMDALCYLLAVQEFQRVDLHMKIIIGDEIAQTTFDKYVQHMHDKVYPPNKPSDVTALVMDGHEKVLVRRFACTSSASTAVAKNKRGSDSHKKASTKTMKKPTMSPKSMKKAKGSSRAMKQNTAKRATKKTHLKKKPSGRTAIYAKKVKRASHHNSGWFMAMTPAGRIVAVTEQVESENNQTVHNTVGPLMDKMPNVDCLVYDRACSIQPSFTKDAKYKQIKYYCVDRLHARGHGEDCACNPNFVPRLKRRISKMNTVICEQTFAWFRTYAKVFNEMSPLRHSFFVHYFVHRHNIYNAAGQADYLPGKDAVTKTYYARGGALQLCIDPNTGGSCRRLAFCTPSFLW